MFISSLRTVGLLMAFVVLTSETTEIEKQSDACIWVDVKFEYGQNESGLQCEGPEKPFNGGYVSDVIREKYNTGDTITYHCNTGHQLIGPVNRTCNGTSKQWEPQEPYCKPEYIGDIMQKLNGIEDQIRVIENRMTTMENNTIQIGHNISVMGKQVTAIDYKVSAIDNNSIMVNKLKAMQLGVRNGRSVSVYTWVIDDFKSKVTSSKWVPYNSTIFYYTVPGHKLKLRGYIDNDSDIRVYLYLVPGEFDDQSTSPLSKKHELTVITNDGSEVIQRSFSGDHSTCPFYQAAPDNYLSCYSTDSKWDGVYKNKKHILSDGSVVITLYIYN